VLAYPGCPGKNGHYTDVVVVAVVISEFMDRHGNNKNSDSASETCCTEKNTHDKNKINHILQNYNPATSSFL